VLKAADIGADPETIGLKGSPTAVRKIFSPPRRGGGEQIQGETVQAQAKTLVAKLREAQVV